MKHPDAITRGRVFTDALGLAAVLHPVATLLAPVSAWADLFTPFHEPAVAMALLAALAALRWRPRTRAPGLLALALLGLDPIVRFAGPPPLAKEAAAAERDRLRVAMINVLWHNDRYEDVRAFLRDESADIVGLIEVSAEWLNSLSDVAETYPHRLELPGRGQGLALWSRRPFVRDGGMIESAGSGGPLAWADIAVGPTVVRIWLAHPPCPITWYGPNPSSTPGLRAVARRIARDPGPTVVIGDLNRTDGSPFFDEFQVTTGLRDSRVGFGRQPSWPSWSPYRLPLDHAFVSADLAVVERRLGPDVGSDHFPLRLVVRKTAVERQ